MIGYNTKKEFNNHVKNMMDNPEKTKILEEQVNVLVKNKVNKVKLKCAECSRKISLLFMYQCYYCHLFYCKKCAKEHFK